MFVINDHLMWVETDILCSSTGTTRELCHFTNSELVGHCSDVVICFNMLKICCNWWIIWLKILKLGLREH